MTASLRISSIGAVSFGGLRDTVVQLPDHDFVVLSGRNEAGKSTLATLLSWLLVGPYGDASSAQRFGDKDTALTAYAEGRLGQHAVRAEGSFKILDRGAPNDRHLTVKVGGATLTTSQWIAEELHGIDDVVLQAVYLMSGADLHDGTLVHKGIAKLAVSGLPGASRAFEVVKALMSESNAALTGRGDGHRSVKTLMTELTKKTGERQELRRSVDRYADLRTERDRREAQRGQISPRRDDLQRQIDSLGTVEFALAEKRTIADLERDRAALEPIDDAWREVAAHHDAIVALCGAIRTASLDLQQASAAHDDVCRRLGLSHAEAALVRVTPLDVQRITTTANMLQQRCHESARATEERHERERDRDLAAQSAADAQQGCSDLSDASLRQIRLDTDEHTHVVSAIAGLRDLQSRAEAATASVREAEGAVALADEGLARREADWSRFHPDLTAEQWLAAPQARGARRGRSVSSRAVAVSAAAMVVSFGAILLAPRAIAAAVVLMALAAAVLATRGASATDADAADDPRVHEAAEAVRRQRVEMSRAAEMLDACRLNAARAREECTSRASRVTEMAAAAGFTSVGPTADDHESRVRVVHRAVSAARALDGAESLLDQARATEQSASMRVHDTEQDLRSTLAACGVPERFDPTAVADRIVDMQSVTDTHSTVHGLRTSIESAWESIRQHTAPVADLITGRTVDDLEGRVRQVASALAAHDRLTADIDAVQRSLDGRLRDDAMAMSLLHDGLDAVAVASRRDELARQLRDLDAEAQGLDQEIGRLKTLLHEAEQSDRLATLQLEIGHLEDRRDQRLIEGVGALLAATVLGGVAEDVRRRHQPALVTRAIELVRRVVPQWDEILIDQTDSGGLQVSVRRTDRTTVAVSRLSTGAQGLLYLALRLAAAEQDAVSNRQGVRFPIICDDPLVHFDDERAEAAATLLASAAESGHQVILFTCHGRTVAAATAAGAVARHLGGATVDQPPVGPLR